MSDDLPELNEADVILDAIIANKKDAERYRWLRENACESYPSAEGSSNKDAYLVITGYDEQYPMSNAQKDAAIDKARGKHD